jgi:type I restriction enzyme M protein
VDLLAYLNTEGWATQMRSLARGSDGLAEISVDDARGVLIPAIVDNDIRTQLNEFIENLKRSRLTLNTTISMLLNKGNLKIYEPKARPSHIVLV